MHHTVKCCTSISHMPLLMAVKVVSSVHLLESPGINSDEWKCYDLDWTAMLL